jgi:hypothetical protein
MSRKFKNKEEFIIHILEELYQKFAPVKFGDFFMEISPSFGIDNFKNLLEELHQQELLTKISEPGDFIQAIGMRTIDLRYRISFKGIEYLKFFKSTPEKEIFNVKEIDKTVEEMINVFVTYSWESEEQNEKVLAFTNFLRDNGFHAEVDKMIIQNETAKDFKVMMHKGMTDFKKVIVVLSSGYKKKAEEFKGGVGNEYALILKDIEDNPNKYILVSFEGIKNDIVPLFFKSREIVNLSTHDEGEKQKLFAKLLDKKEYKFSDVGTKLPEIETKTIPPFFKKQDLIKNIHLNFSQGSASYLARLINHVVLEPNLTFKNDSEEVLNNYNVEIHYPKNTVSYEVDGRIEGEHKIVTLEKNGNIFPQQTKSINLEKITLRDYTIKELMDKSIIVKIYTDKGVFEQIFPISNLLLRDVDGREQKISLEIFNPK